MFFFELLIIILSTKLAGEWSVKFGQPSILGKLIIGIVIGPALLGWLGNSEVIKELSEIGVLLLMFIAGLETELKDLKRNLKASIAVGVGGIIIPFSGPYLIGMAMGMSQANAIFLGLLLSATSVSISVQTLKDLGKLHKKESVTILGAAVVDDVIIVILLAFLMSFIGGSDVSLSMVFLKKILFFILIIFLGWKGAPWIMKKIAPLRVSEAIISGGLIICFLFAYLAETLGVAGIIGAFAAGIAVSHTNYKETVEHRIEPIAYAVFIPIFFVNIGLHVKFEGISEQVWFIVGLSLFSIVAKIIGAGLGAKLTGFNFKSSIGIGTGMISRGEVSLILATIGLEAQLLDETYFTSLILIIIITTIVTPPMLKKFFI